MSDFVQMNEPGNYVAFATQSDSTNHTVVVTTPKGDMYVFDVEQAVGFANGVMIAIARACETCGDAQDRFAAAIQRCEEEVLEMQKHGS